MKQSVGRNQTGGNLVVSKNVSNFKSKKVKSQKRKPYYEQRDKGNIDPKKLKVSQKDDERVMSEDFEKFSKSHTLKTTTKFVGINRKNKLKGKNLHNNYKYEENKIMTNFEGIWILRKNLKSMKKLSKETKLKIISDRKNDKNNVELTPEEQQLYNKKMKASMKLQVKMLKNVMKLNKNSHEIKQKKPGKYLGIDYENDENLVKFGGHFIKKEAAEKIQNSCDSMRAREHFAQYCPLNKKDGGLEKESNPKCFSCNKVGHFSKNCPNKSEPSEDTNIVKCYKCNKVGHFSKSCPVKSKPNEDSNIVKCYKCNEVGHFSKNCPNKSEPSEDSNIVKCYECNEVGHFSKNCPNKADPSEDSKISEPSEDTNIVKCHKCNKVGHFSKNCPNKSKPSEDSNIVKCYKCNEVGHFSKNCPNKSKPIEDSNIVKCYKCNKVGHFSKNCPNKSEPSEYSNIVKCYKCNKVGHFSKSCPNISKNI
ncbi:DNA-binding protein HEXBP [Armadillidium nasatum]|uniref:DNA-binding protein HEXBP n=1 Tax=Armadillidium nasatum TaxID=96803 RepID=A0A5N5SSA5_9CRUS|nr:DNA-binding protein HEXBP [Armadillidium nasatum]